MVSAVGPAIKYFPQQHGVSPSVPRRHSRQDFVEMRNRACVAEIAAVEHHLFVFARRQVHPLVMLVNFYWVLRPNFGRAVAGNVEQARIRMRDPQPFSTQSQKTTASNPMPTPNRYCALYPGRTQSISARAHPGRPRRIGARTASTTPQVDGFASPDYAPGSPHRDQFASVVLA